MELPSHEEELVEFVGKHLLSVLLFYSQAGYRKTDGKSPETVAQEIIATFIF
jgi:hypothetical protein